MATKRLDLYNVVRIKKSHMRRRMTAMARILENEWKRLAANGLNTTSVTYRNNIVVEDVDEDKLVLVLRGTVPNMVEQGLGPSGVGSFGAFDIRTFVLSGTSPNIRSSGGGSYVNVPFRFSTGQIKDLSYSIRGINAPAAAKTLASLASVKSKSGEYTVFNPATGIAGWPQGTLQVGDPLTGKKRAAMDAARGGPPGRLGAGFAPKMRSKPNFLMDPMSGNVRVQEPHRNDPLAGLVKFGKTYASTTQSTYGTFRRMSSKGKPWIHPGIKPRKFAEKLDLGKAMSLAFMDLV